MVTANAARNDVLIAGIGSLVAGATAMAVGEYVSVRSQADTDKANRARERDELGKDVGFERQELATIYVKANARGLSGRTINDPWCLIGACPK
jgi:vacuolar iron transporter family protein